MKVLDGIRILDFSRHMAGPYATAALSDFGADVIKIESVPFGDPSRRSGTVFTGGQSGLFLVWNRGKRSMAVDLRKDEGLDIIYRLAATCDVVVENYRPGVADEIGVGYDTLSALNDQLIYVSISAFGSTGPWASDLGTDPLIQAMSGLMSVTGEPDGEPQYVGVPIADFTAAMVSFQAVLLGLLSRNSLGRGQKIEIPMLAALMPSLTTRLASHWYGGEVPTRFGNQHSVFVPYQLFRTLDGYVVAGAWGPDEAWPRFCRALGRADLIDRPEFKSNRDRVAHRSALNAILDEEFRQKTSAEWRDIFHTARALFGPVLTIPEALTHEQISHLGLVTAVEHPTLGPIPELKPAIDMTDTPGEVALPAPLYGQHTVEILTSLGYGADDIEQLVLSSVVVAAQECACS